MPFNANIPLANDRLAKSQQDLLQNNKQLDTSFAVNHYAFSDLSANNGMHKFVQLVNQPVIPPGLVTGAETLYSKEVSALGELFYTRGNIGTEIQMTGPGDPSIANKGYTFLPGGMLIQWGFINSTASSYTDLLFATANRNFPTKCIFISTQPYSGASEPNSQATVTIRDNSVSNLGFKWAFVTNSGAYTGFYWMALGF